MRVYRDPVAAEVLKERIREEAQSKMSPMTASFIGALNERKFTPGVSLNVIARYMEQTEACMNRNGVDDSIWNDKKPEHLMALYLILHQHVYGVFADDAAKEWKFGVSAAKRLTDSHFKKTLANTARYVTWLFGRQMNSKKQTDWRMGWRYVFINQSPLVDYRLFLKRAQDR